MRAIDIHCHMVPEGFPAAPCNCAARWPRMDHRDNRQAMVMAGSREFRLVDSRAWDIDRRMEDMDGDGTLIQAVSPMPELLSYWFEPQDALTLARHINEAIGEMVRKRPDRFRGLGMVPLQDPDLATRELASVKALGLSGVEIGSNINGKSPGDPAFDAFYAEAERLGLCVFIHALHPTNTDRLVGPKRLSALICFPTDVGMAAASMITSDTLVKTPRLRLAFSHGGGTFASFLPRLQSGWDKLAAIRAEFAHPTETARKMYFDNVVFDQELLRHLISVFGANRICVGSDYPFKGGQRNSPATIAALDLPPEIRDDIMYNNAAHFLGIG